MACIVVRTYYHFFNANMLFADYTTDVGYS